MTGDASLSMSYKSVRFSSDLPKDRLNSASHFWLKEEDQGLRRVGFTQFATRMLGEIVDYADGEALLGWLNATVRLSSLADFNGNEYTVQLTRQVQELLGAYRALSAFQTQSHTPKSRTGLTD